ncbi:MAG: molybdopterin molybdotransferase MoeA [Anaerolineae bacterium]
MNPLIPVEDALSRILAEFSTLSAEHVPLTAAQGRILAEAVHAPHPLPPFPNSSMDGFAVHVADILGATRETPITLPVVMDVPAGRAPEAPLPPGTAARIMTGAVVPEGANAVIPVEDTNARWESEGAPDTSVTIFHAAEPGSNIRLVGEDVQQGQAVLQADTELGPAEIGVLAALGYASVPVIQRPVVAILSTGDELIEIDQPLQPGKIRNSNGYVLEALVRQYGGVPVRLPTARDTLAEVRARFKEALAQSPQIILSSGGVSVGAYDVVKAVLDELGEVRLWRVNLRPGKPLAFGHVGGVPFFGLPGNPVSAQVTFDIFVRPAVLKLGGRHDHTPVVEAVLDETLRTDGRETYFRVRLRRAEDGTLHATTTGTQSSGAMLSMVRADGLLIVPAGKTARAGERYTVRLLRPLV